VAAVLDLDAVSADVIDAGVEPDELSLDLLDSLVAHLAARLRCRANPRRSRVPPDCARAEASRRFRPEAARAELVRALTHPQLGPLDAEDEEELLDALESLRRRQAARLLRDTLSG
jgi:hypothetical protein